VERRKEEEEEEEEEEVVFSAFTADLLVSISYEIPSDLKEYVIIKACSSLQNEF
jgi:hypothetical protein